MPETTPRPAPPKPRCYLRDEAKPGTTHFCTKHKDHEGGCACPCGKTWS